MESSKLQTISGLNEHIQELRKKADEIETTVSLLTFSGHENVNIRYLLRPIKDVELFTEDTYKPDGMTAMYDGVAKLVYSVKNAVKDDDDLTSYLVLVVSDGEENASKEFNSEKVASIIKEVIDTKKWSINYIGANQDLSVVQKSIGLESLRGNTLGYDNSAAGTSQMWNTLNNSTARYRGNVLYCATAQSVSKSIFQPEDSTSDNTTPILTDN